MGKYKKISTLKACLTKSEQRERHIRDQIMIKAAGEESLTGGDFVRWCRQLRYLKRNQVNFKARLAKALKEQEIELEKQKSLENAAKPTKPPDPKPAGQVLNRVGLILPESRLGTGENRSQSFPQRS